MSKTENNIKRRRFHKPYGLYHRIKKHPWKCLRKLFQTFHLEDMRSEMEHWVRVALINDQSAYEAGVARAHLMEFSDKLLCLAEALYIMNENHRSIKRDKKASNLSDGANASIKKSNLIMRLSDEQKNKPATVVTDFSDGYSFQYCKAEIWDLLDAVVTCDSDKQVYKGILVLFCQSLLAMVSVAFVFHNDKTFQTRQ